MKKSELKRKVKELIKQSLNAGQIDRMVDRIVSSGCIDLESAEDNYNLPKNVVCAIAKQLQYDYRPLIGDREQWNQIENIYGNI